MKFTAIHIVFVITFLLLTSCNDIRQTKANPKSVPELVTNPSNAVLLSSEIKWEKLNPDRGNQSPQAATIWGNRNGTEATGFLAKFVDGFSSPPHIHNITYRAVVIKGLLHNDDENAKEMWMKPGSFWTQPQGESHITASKGESIALVEIDNGPYLVKPINKAFDTGERPVNIDASNIIWLNQDKSNWIDKSSKAELSFLSEKAKLRSLFIKLPTGYSGKIETEGTILQAVVTQGELNYILPQTQETKVLDLGSSFSSIAKAVHTISHVNTEVILYVRTNGSLKIYEL